MLQVGRCRRQLCKKLLIHDLSRFRHETGIAADAATQMPRRKTSGRVPVDSVPHPAARQATRRARTHTRARALPHLAHHGARERLPRPDGRAVPPARAADRASRKATSSAVRCTSSARTASSTRSGREQPTIGAVMPRAQCHASATSAMGTCAASHLWPRAPR